MSDTSALSRRALLLGSVTGLVAIAGAVACSAEPVFSCTDVTGLAPFDITTRATLRYADRSPDPDRTCKRCVQFISGVSGACGTCKVMRGPVHPNGTCSSFTRGS